METAQTHYKEVQFSEWCPKCKYRDHELPARIEKEEDLVCEECLSHGVNLGSRKPINYKEA